MHKILAHVNLNSLFSFYIYIKKRPNIFGIRVVIVAFYLIILTYLQFYSLNSEIISITFYVIIVTFTSYYLKAQLPKKGLFNSKGSKVDIK